MKALLGFLMKIDDLHIFTRSAFKVLVFLFLSELNRIEKLEETLYYFLLTNEAKKVPEKL